MRTSERLMMEGKSDDRISRLNGQAETWFERARHAYHANKIDLSRQALFQRWQCRRQIAEIEGRPVPEQPKEPEHYFGKQDNFDPHSPHGPGSIS